MEHIEIIKDDHEVLAIIIRNNFTSDGIKIFTPDDFSQQLAYMHHKRGKKIRPHSHKPLKREIRFTQEVLFIKSGRLKIVPFFLMMLLAWIINAGSFSVPLKRFSITLIPYTVLGLIALILTPLYLSLIFLLKPKLGYFTPHFIRNIPFWIEFISVLLGMVSLALIVFYGMYPRLARVIGVFLCLMILLQIGTVLKYGMFVEKKYDRPTFGQIRTQKKEKLDFNYHQNPGMVHSIVLTHLAQSFIEPFLGKIYTQVIPVSSSDDAYTKMRQKRLPQQLFIEGYDPEKANRLTDVAKDIKEGTVKLEYSSFNRMKFRVVSQSSAFFGFSYPYTGHWRAWVNGEKVKVYRANGAAHAVEIPEGESIVEFRYWSDAFFWGMIISSVTFLMFGLFVSFNALKGFRRIIVVFLLLIFGIGGFIFLYQNLYTSDNLKTEYVWVYDPPQYPPNLAYGKKTSGFSVQSAFLHLHGSNAVDGDKRHGSGFVLRPTHEPLVVDLNQDEIIKTIILYGEFNKGIPEIFISQDGKEWQMIKSEDIKTGFLRIIFEKPQITRYIKVKTPESEVGIDELEVYGE